MGDEGTGGQLMGVGGGKGGRLNGGGGEGRQKDGV